ncbi:hypothetical protein ACFL6X_02575 [Candidatus Latescibacterota bacterium]
MKLLSVVWGLALTLINYYWQGSGKVQVNYTWRDTDEPYLPDLDDNALLVSAQLTF